MTGRLVLLVEDHENDVFLVRRALIDSLPELQLAVVPDGEKALEYLRGEGPFADRSRHPFPALLLLDLKLPCQDGFDVLRAVRQDPQLRRLVVVMLTSSSHKSDVNQAYSLGVNSYLVKPTSFDDLVLLFKHVVAYWVSLNLFADAISARRSEREPIQAGPLPD